jgi:hypothetical protein
MEKKCNNDEHQRPRQTRKTENKDAKKEIGPSTVPAKMSPE